MTEDPAWDEAFARVESYLRAHGMESRLLLNQVSAEIIVEAQKRASGGSGGEPVTLAIQGARARIGAWISHPPAELVSAQVPSGPEVIRTSMSAEPLKFGFIDSDFSRIRAMEVWFKARAIVSWLIIFGFFGMIWESSH